MTHMTQAKLDSIGRKIARAEALLAKAADEVHATGTAYSLEMGIYRAVTTTQTAQRLVASERRSNSDCGDNIFFNGERPRYAPKPAKADSATTWSVS
jgi:hypothetical protein